MYTKLIVLSVAAACVFAAPPTDVVPLEKQQPTVIPIISQSDELEANGTYKFSYETGNGIKREEEAYEKVLPKAEGRSHSSSNEGGESDEDSNEIHVQRGSYSYTAPDGTVITLSYIADENGFQPTGKHLPRVPVPAQSVDASSEKAGRALKSASDNKASASEAKSEAKPAPESKPAAASESTPAAGPESTPVAAPENTSTAAPESTPAAIPESTSAPVTENTSTPAEKTEDSPKESTTESITTNAASGENSAETASTIIPSQPTSAENTEAPISTTAPEQVTTSSNEQQTTNTLVTEAASQSVDVNTSSTNEPKSASEEATTVSLSA